METVVKRQKGKPTEKQKNMADVPKKIKRKDGKPQFDGSQAPILETQEPEKLRQKITVTPYEEKSKFLKIKTVKDYRYAQVIGASGVSLVPESKLKEISDPYKADTRTSFTDVILGDPVAAPAARYSIAAIFEDGFDLQLTLASTYNSKENRQLTPEEIEVQLKQWRETYEGFLEKLVTWKDDCDVEQLAKDLHGVWLAQGKAAGMVLPGILDLKKDELPTLCEIIPADDLSNPIVDVGLTRKIVAVKLNLSEEEKEDPNIRDILRADELIYYVHGIRGLRREAKYHGVSPLEPVLQISKALRNYYQLHAPLVMIASYVVKQLIKVSKENMDEALQQRVSQFMSNLFKSTTWAMAMPDWYDGVDQVQAEVDWPMFDGIEHKLATTELNAIGVPKSAMNREQDLNRDIATIQAIQFVRFMRKPVEEAIKKTLEIQLFNPLFAHLAQTKLSDLPVRVEIVRKIPEGGDIDTLFDQMSAEKNEDIDDGNLQQNESQNPIAPVTPTVD